MQKLHLTPNPAQDMNILPPTIGQYISQNKFHWQVGDLAKKTEQTNESVLNSFFDFIATEKKKHTHIQFSLKNIKKLYETQPKKFYSMMMSSVCQGYRVTKNAPRILNNGFNLQGINKEKLQEFVDEETGHDLLMKSSLDNLSDLCGIDWAVQPAMNLQSLSDLLTLFEWSSKNFLLSFCCLIFEFESALPLEKDPFWSWVNNNKNLKKIFAGVLKHKKINTVGHHDKVHINLINKDKKYSKADYVLAARLQETAIKMIVQNNVDVLEKYKQTTC